MPTVPAITTRLGKGHMGVKMTDLDHNYTDAVSAFYEDRLHKLGHYARQWPLRVAHSKVGKGHPTHIEGTNQCHLLCWLEKDDGRTHCGQGIFPLAIGVNRYTVDPNGIIHAIQAHIMQCHAEVIEHAD